jgi:hypothetical protein
MQPRPVFGRTQLEHFLIGLASVLLAAEKLQHGRVKRVLPDVFRFLGVKLGQHVVDQP